MKVYLGVKIPKELEERLLILVALESQRTGYRQNKTDVVTKILEKALEGVPNEKVPLHSISTIHTK